jgi:hypothetical protein
VLAFSIRGIWMLFFFWLALLVIMVAVHIPTDDTPYEPAIESFFDSVARVYVASPSSLR